MLNTKIISGLAGNQNPVVQHVTSPVMTTSECILETPEPNRKCGKLRYTVFNFLGV
jgi:hypothetical protein